VKGGERALLLPRVRLEPLDCRSNLARQHREEPNAGRDRVAQLPEPIERPSPAEELQALAALEALPG
jgi:hypothetical protein